MIDGGFLNSAAYRLIQTTGHSFIQSDGMVFSRGIQDSSVTADHQYLVDFIDPPQRCQGVVQELPD